MIYHVETPIDTTSTAHYRTFLKVSNKAKKGGADVDNSGSMASRAFA